MLRTKKSFQKNFLHKILLDTWNAVCTTMPKTFCQKAQSFSLNGENDKNTYSFREKIIFHRKFSVDT